MPDADSHLAREIRTQPDDWTAVAERAGSFADALPARGARVAVVGCGTSLFMGRAYAVLRETAGHGETDAFPASEMPARRYDHVLALTRSGTTTEVLEVLRSARARDVPTTAVVATPGTPATTLADQVVLLPEVDEQSVVQTRFATSTLALLRASLGQDVAAVAAQARAILDEPEHSAVDDLVSARQVTFLGRGWTVGVAEEAALKLRESTQLWTESYPAMEYRHGPIAIAEPGRVVWALGDLPDGLADEVAATGARLEHRDVDALAELVRVHRVCLAKARRASLDPDHPRHLSRSVVLDETT